jgi:nicotinamidase-related amidase
MKAHVALLLVDVVNAFDFEGSGPLVRAATRAAKPIARLADRARRERVPVIYVNDNFGKWRSDFRAIVEACAQPEQKGAEVVARLRPHEGDYFVLKPQHSGFYETTLERLLESLGARTLILSGFATNLCVAFTANDAHMRGYHVVVPSDCSAANTPALHRAALSHVRVALGGVVVPSRAVSFGALRARTKKPRGQPF